MSCKYENKCGITKCVIKHSHSNHCGMADYLAIKSGDIEEPEYRDPFVGLRLDTSGVHSTIVKEFVPKDDLQSFFGVGV